MLEFLGVLWSYELLIKCIKLQCEMKAETDRFGREKKELVEQFRDVESQLEWVRSERQDEIDKLSSEKKTLLDRLHEAETQLSLLKTRKRDELKVWSLCTRRK